MIFPSAPRRRSTAASCPCRRPFSRVSTHARRGDHRADAALRPAPIDVHWRGKSPTTGVPPPSGPPSRSKPTARHHPASTPPAPSVPGSAPFRRGAFQPGLHLLFRLGTEPLHQRVDRGVLHRAPEFACQFGRRLLRNSVETGKRVFVGEFAKSGGNQGNSKRPGVIFHFFTRLRRFQDGDPEAGCDVKDGFSEPQSLDRGPSPPRGRGHQ